MAEIEWFAGCPLSGPTLGKAGVAMANFDISKALCPGSDCVTARWQPLWQPASKSGTLYRCGKNFHDQTLSAALRNIPTVGPKRASSVSVTDNRRQSHTVDCPSQYWAG
jgi:hypothetical protein